jgi:hypothetical protein
MNKIRKVFFVVVSGGHATEKHYQDTIERKRSLEELEPFLTKEEVTVLKDRYYGGPFSLWGAVPGSGNLRTWNTMETGDYVLIYKYKKIIFAAEVALKTHNIKLSEYLWGRDLNDETWEYMYFLVNPQMVNVPMSQFNPYLGYSENFFPRGFSTIEQDKANGLLTRYGDILSSLKKLERGEVLKKVFEKPKQEVENINKKVKGEPTAHDEMQWRLINLGKKTKVDVWVPDGDKNTEFEGHTFRDEILPQFQETLDVPLQIRNIDVVWKYGYSIKCAFEIESTTSVFSGILRLSDLRAVTPNSNYPLFIVADRERRNKVFSELRRPTFDNPYLNMKAVTRYLSFDKVRELDENIKDENSHISVDFLISQSEAVE